MLKIWQSDELQMVWVGSNGDTWVRVPARFLRPEQECVAYPRDAFKAQAGTLPGEALVYVLVYDGELVWLDEEELPSA